MSHSKINKAANLKAKQLWGRNAFANNVLRSGCEVGILLGSLFEDLNSLVLGRGENFDRAFEDAERNPIAKRWLGREEAQAKALTILGHPVHLSLDKDGNCVMFHAHDGDLLATKKSFEDCIEARRLALAQEREQYWRKSTRDGMGKITFQADSQLGKGVQRLFTRLKCAKVSQ